MAGKYTRFPQIREVSEGGLESEGQSLEVKFGNRFIFPKRERLREKRCWGQVQRNRWDRKDEGGNDGQKK